MFASKDVFLNPPSGGYTISRSVRFRSSASANLNRTYAGTGTSATIKTLSMWVKRGTLGSAQRLANSNAATAGTTYFRFNASDNLDFQFESAGGIALTTTQVFRDISSWYHIVLAIDTTQATAANRVKIYVNGVQVTAFSAANYPAQNATTSLFGFASAANRIGSDFNAASEFFDGYMAEINHVDGQALTPSSFGAISTNGVWQPARYTGTYGTNGFYLKFADNSTAAALGTDSSGNSNTWTVNNINVTAYSGTPADNTSYDSMTDVPTLTSATAANYAVLNAAAPAPGSTSITNGNLSWAQTAASLNRAAIATFGMSSGKWYWECAVGASIGANNSLYFGIAQGSFTLTNYCGATTTSWGYTSGSGNKVTNGSGTAYGATFTSNDVIGFAFDADAGTITAYKNGASQGTMFTGLTSGPYFAVVSESIGGGGTANLIRSMNFGQRPFTSTPPTGFVALNTYNLSTPTISNGAAYMAATLYTGNNSTLAVTNTVNGVSFQPDFAWIKSRSAATSHSWMDVLRGYTGPQTSYPRLSSDLTAAELNNGGITAFNSTGFNLNNDAAIVNTNAATYVAWQWKANGTGVTNTSGSITSTVSAGTTQGFSVVTYTGTGSTSTVGHGLGAIPSMVIVKTRSNVNDWMVKHINLTSGNNILLNSTAAQSAPTVNGYIGDLSSSTTFSLVAGSSTSQNVNASGWTYVAYCFAAVAGYSAFGSYTGNGSTDGPFVYLGFRPRFLLIKRTDAIANWRIHDSSRDTYDVTSKSLYPNLSNAETSAASEYWDFLSNGFKLRTSDAESNASAGTYIYMAFAENPFRYALAF